MTFNINSLTPLQKFVSIALVLVIRGHLGGTTAAAPPPFRPGNPALFGSYPL